LLSDLDTNGDGVVSAAELASADGGASGAPASSGLSQLFAALDAAAKSSPISTQGASDAFQKLLTASPSPQAGQIA
jgi:hypothetical protein